MSLYDTILSTGYSDTGLTEDLKNSNIRRKLKFSDGGSDSESKLGNGLVFVDNVRMLESPFDTYMSAPSINGREHLYIAKLCD